MRSHATLLLLLALASAACARGGAPAEKASTGRASQAMTSSPAIKLTALDTVEQATATTAYSPLVPFDGAFYFWVSSTVVGSELWRTDGTAAGTKLIKDITPGRAWISIVPALAPLGRTLFFSGDDGSTGSELWSSDGTPEGTAIVADLVPGPGSSSPADFTTFAGRTYFTAAGADGARRLWSTDGTTAGTKALGDTPAAGPLLAVGSTLYFFAPTRDWPTLWKTDGTSGGTMAVATLAGTGTPSLSLGTRWLQANGALYVATWSGLWTTDGTAGHTIQLSTTPALNTVAHGGAVFFESISGAACCALWRTDGTAAGTSSVGSVRATALSVANNKLYFVGTDGSGQASLWSSDGTAGGSASLGYTFGPGDAVLYSFVASGTDIYARFLGDGYYAELWKADSLTGATTRLLQSKFRPAEYAIDDLTPVPGGLLFAGGSPTAGWQYYRTDGTPARTVALSTRLHTLDPIATVGLTGVQDKVFFNAAENAHNNELWRTDGTPGGTALVKPLPNVSDQETSPLARFTSTAVWDGKLLFASDSSLAPADQLEVSDGTANGTSSIGPFTMPETPMHLVVQGQTAFFVGDSGLWKTDGTTAGTTLLAPGAKALVALGNTVLYATSTSLFALDPVSAMSIRLADGSGFALVAGRQRAFVTSHTCPTAGAACVALWTTDGTATGTVLVTQLPREAGTMTTVGDQLFFALDDGQSGAELWTSDGTVNGTQLVKDIAAGTGGSNPFLLTAVGGKLYFFANDGLTGYELWSSDGTAAGTQLVKDLRPGASGSNAPLADPLATIGASTPVLELEPEGLLLFAATDGQAGTELWASDGTAANTVLVADVQAGLGSSNPRQLMRSGDIVYFTADDGTSGQQVYALKISDIPGLPQIACPPNVTAEATSAAGAKTMYPAATSNIGTAKLTYSNGSGSLFPLGVTPVTARASLASGAGTECTFTVTVADTTPPKLTCPGDEETSGDASGASVTFPNPTATDAVTASPTVSVDRQTDSHFPVGATVVHVTARDAAGNSSTCSFTVKVDAPPAPAPAKKSGCGCQGSSPVGALWPGALLLLRRRRLFHRRSGGSGPAL